MFSEGAGKTNPKVFFSVEPRKIPSHRCRVSNLCCEYEKMSAVRLLLVIATVLCFVVLPTKAEDLVEFLTGAKMRGTVVEIRKDAQEFEFRAALGSRTVLRTYPFSKVHAVTYRGRRFVLTPMSEDSSIPSESGDDAASANVKRSVAEIDRLVDRVGSTMPEGIDSLELDYPPSLDLSWPIKAEGSWNNQKNVGQFIWDVINPNPSRWPGGIKLVYHIMATHQGQPELLKRDQHTLARMYFDFFQDYPRAAYWLRRSGVEKGQGPAVMLAECYWRLGNQRMALPYLVSRSYNAGAAARAIKLYGNMGMYADALEMTERVANSTASYEGLIAAGDAMRQSGRYDKAIDFYNRVLSDENFRNKDYEKRFKARARESIAAIELYEKTDLTSIADGTYTSDSTGYNGPLEVAVKVASGQIESVKVTRHREKQFYSALTDTENSILRLQTIRGVDGTSGATITSRAIVNAAAKALASGSK